MKISKLGTVMVLAGVAGLGTSAVVADIPDDSRAQSDIEAPTAELELWCVQSARHKREALRKHYLARPDRNADHEAQMLAFLDEFSLHLAGAPNIDPIESLLESGESLIDAGETAPELSFGVAFARAETGDLSGALKLYPTTVIELTNMGGLRHIASLAARHCADLLVRIDQPKAARGHIQLAGMMLLSALDSREFEPGFPRRLFVAYFKHITAHKACDEEIFKVLFTMLDRSTSIDMVSKNTIMGRHHIDLAWEARGSGWASTVTPEGQKGLRKNLDIARRYFTRAHEKDPTRPEAAIGMITVMMAGRRLTGESAADWFERAIDADPTCYEAYAAFSNFILPRWHGSLELALGFGLACKDSGMYEAQIPFHLFHIAWLCSTNPQIGDKLWEVPGLYDEIADMFEQMCQFEYLRGRHDFYRSIWAGLAVKTGHTDDARTQLELLDDRVDESLLRYYFQMTASEVRQQAGLQLASGDDISPH